MANKWALVAISGVSAIAVAVLLFAVANATTGQDSDDVVSTEDYRVVKEVRYPAARSAALADPRVQEVLNSAVLNRTDFELLDNEDKVTISTWGKMRSTGSWQNGYTLYYSEGNVADVSVDRNSNAVVSVNVTPREDKVSTWSFSDNQKKLISILVSDSRFQKDFAGKTDANDYFFSVVRNSASDEPNSPGFIVITSPTDNKVLYFARIEPVAEKVLSVQKGLT